ncbi:MAG: hypothetical protein C5B49_15705 [Bdellovibrio sp.]|nr:MAG: hypothetical protein C5B49_15705 [Bdellovibrio sp.]
MAKSKQDDLIKYDSRMIEINIARGLLTREEYLKYLADLPDNSSIAVPLILDDEDSRESERH